MLETGGLSDRQLDPQIRDKAVSSCHLLASLWNPWCGAVRLALGAVRVTFRPGGISGILGTLWEPSHVSTTDRRRECLLRLCCFSWSLGLVTVVLSKIGLCFSPARDEFEWTTHLPEGEIGKLRERGTLHIEYVEFGRSSQGKGVSRC